MDASTLRFIMELADLLGKAPCIPVTGTYLIVGITLIWQLLWTLVTPSFICAQLKVCTLTFSNTDICTVDQLDMANTWKEHVKWCFLDMLLHPNSKKNSFCISNVRSWSSVFVQFTFWVKISKISKIFWKFMENNV